MLVVDEPLADEVLVVLDVLVELAELPDLYADDDAEEIAEQEERVEPAGYEDLRLDVGDEEGHDAVGHGVGDGQGEAETADDRGGELGHDEAQVHLADAVVVGALDGQLEPPLGAHHRHGRGDFRVEHACGRDKCELVVVCACVFRGFERVTF